MSSVDRSGEAPVKPRPKHPALLLLGTAADTSWRMFVPVIGTTILGLVIDKKLHTTPWIMIVLMAGGIWLATVLVLRQIAAAKKDKTF